MRVTDQLLVEALVATVATGDFDMIASYLSEDIEFFVRMPAYSPSMLGDGRGREALVARLKAFAAQVEITEFRLLRAEKINDRHECRVRYGYRHRRSGLEIDGLMRLFARIEEESVVSIEIIYDSDRMVAFAAMAKSGA